MRLSRPCGIWFNVIETWFSPCNWTSVILVEHVQKSPVPTSSQYSKPYGPISTQAPVRDGELLGSKDKPRGSETWSVSNSNAPVTPANVMVMTLLLRSTREGRSGDHGSFWIMRR